MEYTCKKGFKVHSFRLGQNSIRVSIKGLLDFEEYEVPYESIGDRKVVGIYASDTALISSLFAILFSIIFLWFESGGAFLLFAFIGLVSLAYGIFTRQGIVTLQVLYGENVKLYFSRKQKTEAVEFAETLIVEARAFVKKKYSVFDKKMPLEKQFDNLEYLKDRNLVTASEYDEIKNYLLGNGKRSIGFNN